MAKDFFSNHTTNTIIIAVLVILFILVIYIPKSIWDEEVELRDDSRFRMNAITQAERLFYILSRQYTEDLDLLHGMLHDVRDSVRAAANDTNMTYAGYQFYIKPAMDIGVDYSDEYIASYLSAHRELFAELTPNHHMSPEQVHALLDTVNTLYLQGDYIGEQQIELDTLTTVSFTVPDKFDIMYQNVKTLMFNALTGSFTPYPDFANPLVDAVLDTIAKDTELSGRTDFVGLYDKPIKIDFQIPFDYEKGKEKEYLKWMKQLSINEEDSIRFGDTLYGMALDTFMVVDTAEFVPEYFEFNFSYIPEPDTAGLDSAALDTMSFAMEPDTISIGVTVNVEGMEAAKVSYRNTMYKSLTGYNEPSAEIAERIIAIADDSLAANPAIYDSIHAELDVSETVFTVNVHRNIPDYYNKISRENAYFNLNVNLTELNWDSASVEVVEKVASLMEAAPDFREWQVVEVPSDTFYVNVQGIFLRHYDNMNIALYEQLTGEFNNVHTHVNRVIKLVEEYAAVDSLEFSGSQTVQLPADTFRIFVPEEYSMLYDSTFVTYRDTVIQVDDSTFTGVFTRKTIPVAAIEDWDTLSFIYQRGDGMYAYRFEDADSVRDINVREKADTSKAEKAYFNEFLYVVTFNEDSLAETVHRVIRDWEEPDSMIIDVIDSMRVVSQAIVAGEQEKPFIAKKDSFGGWLDTTVAKRYDKIQLVDTYPYEKIFNQCTVTELPFRVTIRNNVNLTVESPITEEIKSRRYLFFAQVDSSHGRIVDGEPSWAR